MAKNRSLIQILRETPYFSKESRDSFQEIHRRYVISLPVLCGIAFFGFALWKYTFTSWEFSALIVLIIVQFLLSFFPLRVYSKYAMNEYIVDDFVYLLCFCLLDPFQCAVVVSIGTFTRYFVWRSSYKSVVLNTTYNFVVGGAIGFLIQSPIENNRWYFMPLLILACGLFYVLDPLSFWAACKFSFRETINSTLISLPRALWLTICILFTPAAALLFDSRPVYSSVIFAGFFLTLTIINRLELARSQSRHSDQLLTFMSDVANEKNHLDVDARTVELAKNAFMHEKVELRSNGPSSQEHGVQFISLSGEEKWLIVQKSGLSHLRDNADRALLQSIADAARSAVQYENLQLQLVEMARRDSLTGLLNRGSLEEIIHRETSMAKRKDETYAVLFIDLDKFKPVNDHYGHKAGDVVLKTVAARISDSLREHDVVARIGGDEFVVVCRELDHVGAQELSKRIVAIINKPITLPQYCLDGDHSSEVVSVGASVGISIYPHDGTEFESLVKSADGNMYRVKRSSAKLKGE